MRRRLHEREEVVLRFPKDGWLKTLLWSRRSKVDTLEVPEKEDVRSNFEKKDFQSPSCLLNSVVAMKLNQSAG